MYALDNGGPSSSGMERQDSGYESISLQDAQPTSKTTGRKSVSSASGRARPTHRRPQKTGAVARLARTSKLSSRSPMSQKSPVTVTPSFHGYHDSSPYSHPATASTSYFYFPPPDPHAHDDVILPSTTDDHDHGMGHADSPSPYPMPPQTTHYWTSDSTRRLEYAAIDAASRGFKGWMLRHVVPGCFVPKDKRRITFDDDTGSVRRYRIELESDDSAEKDPASTHVTPHGQSSQKKGRTSAWWF